MWPPRPRLYWHFSVKRVIPCHVAKMRLMTQNSYLWICVKYWQIKTLYCYCDLSGSSKVKGHGAKWKIIFMFLSINNSNYMSNSRLFKDIGTFLSTKMVNAQSRDQICTCCVVQYSVHNFIEFFGPNQKSLSLKMAEIWQILWISCFVISHDQYCTDWPKI